PPPPTLVPRITAVSMDDGSPAMPRGSENVTASEKSSGGVEFGTLTFALETVPSGTFAAVPLASVKTSNGLTPVNVSPYVGSFVTAADTPQPSPKQPPLLPLISLIRGPDASPARPDEP